MADEETQDEQLDEVQDELNQDVDEAGEKTSEKESLEAKLKAVIDVQVEEVAPLRRKLTITVPRDTLDGQVNEQYDELRREAMVPGFRKGRAPRRLLEKRFGTEVGETLVQQLVSTGYMAAVDKTGLKALGDPLIYVKSDGRGEVLEEVQTAIGKMKLPPEGPLVFSCEIEIRPEFELPVLEGIPLEKPIITVSDDDVSRQIDRIRGIRGHFEPVNEGGVQADDTVTADLKMTSDGTVLKEQADIRLAARPQVVDGVILEKLGETLVGAKAGDTVTISGAIGDDYVKAEFRGKEATFEFKIKDVQRMHLPELNADFLKGFGFDSEEELRKWVREDLESRLEEEVKQVLRGRLSQYLLDKVSFDLPERLSNRQINQVTANRVLGLYRQGVSPADAEKLMDELKTSSRKDAVRDLKLAFIMEKLAEEIEVEVTEGEINSVIAAIAQRQGQRFDRVRDQMGREGLTTLYVRLRDEKILDQLIGKATITEAKIEDIKAREKAGGEKPAVPAEVTSGSTAGPVSQESAEAPMPREQVKRTPPKKPDKDKGADFADET